MPRKSKKSEVLQLGNPRENILEHRNFLARALSRNDTELKALIQVNESLQKAKEAILQSCGELVLLDLGAGRLKLINDELHEETTSDDVVHHHLSPAQNDLCVDFLLRMKLRRKLSNRLARRLNRIAHSMDGEDVAPPPPPRYGDLSLNFDPEAVRAKELLWKQREDAKNRLAKAKLEGTDKQKSSGETSDNVKREEDASSDNKEAKMDEDAGDSKDKQTEEPSSTMEPKQEQIPPAPVKSTDVSEQNEDDGSLNDDNDFAHAFSDNESTKSSEKDKKEDKKEETKDKEDPASSSSERDQDILKIYNAAYEKIWDPNTKMFKYSMSSQKTEPDYNAIQGTGIGSTSRPMGEEEKQLEHLRWQTAVLARIPKQPTFEELGRENHVFCFEERRKRCLEEVDRDGEEVENNKKSKQDGDDDKAGARNGEKEKDETSKKTNESDEESNENESDEENEQKKANDNKNSKSSEKQEKEAIKAEEEFKEIRPMSLAAVPSFYDQDMKRLRSIHLDLVKQSIDELARAKLTRTTEKYNSALYKSIALSNRRQQLQTQLALSVEKGRREIATASSEYALALTIAKQKWIKEKKEHDAKRMETVLPSRYNQLPMGTVAIQNFCRRSPNALAVGSTLADIVDSIVMTSEGKLPVSQKFPDFEPPPGPTLSQQRMQEQAAIKHEGTNVINHLTQSEETRKFAWRNLMRLKAETELKYGMVSRRTAASTTNLPMPALNRATQQAIPHLNFAFPTKAGYTPSRPPSSDPKYSSAQVRKRIGNDGTVAPVSEPKKTKDGLYMRPAGRQRKGMQWDSLRGIWVPEGSLD